MNLPGRRCSPHGGSYDTLDSSFSMEYTIRDIARALSINPPAAPAAEAKVSVLLTDSRSLVSAPDSIFFALRTPTGDGHRYLAELYARGVRHFVVESGAAPSPGPEAVVMEVADTSAALRKLAAAHRSRFAQVPVIAVTGSRGKTIVKEWLHLLLGADRRVTRSPRSFNSQIGVPLSVWQMDGDTQLAIFEAGVSRSAEMAPLEEILRPDVTIITNITDEHHEGFHSRAAKAAEKVSLARRSRAVVYCADMPEVDSAVSALPAAVERLGWSAVNESAPCFVTTSVGPASTEVAYTFRPTGITGVATVPFTAPADVENAIHCLVTLLRLGVAPEQIAERMSRLPHVDTRLEVIEGVSGSMLVNDRFTNDLQSLTTALDFARRRATPEAPLWLILGDLLPEPRLTPAELYSRVAALLKLHGITRLTGIGPQLQAHAALFGPGATFFPDTDSFLSSIDPERFHGSLVLVKGAPDAGFDRITERLERRQHETVLEVNLDAVARNLSFFRSRLKPSTGIVCMVKAFGYGAGSYELAKTLQSQGAAYLAVAAHDEGTDLRRAGITMPIMVLNPKVADYGPLFDYNLEPEIYSLDILRQIIAEATRRGVKNYPVHIKLDTGMHRLGFLEEELPEVASLLLSQDAVTPKSIFSHLCCADDPADDDYTHMQFDYFDRCTAYFQSRFSHRILRHILNSAGIIRFPEHQCDMVRLGIGLYGIHILPDGSDAALERVSSLRSVIISIRNWPAGTTIGYNRRGRLTRPSRIATIPIGYADGLDRHLGYGNLSVNVNGHPCPTVGSICMDVMMIDVTDAPCAVGDRVELFGNEVPTEEVASSLTTIPYEILTSVSRRVKRVYYRE
ncbi:MAG: bifunctional UDP-N-acetylmuramoyl-tripeptide:D-alanyl-D-alanine ligase/alanine racemase [Bacteroides sp.]|nr:bifunctional UDP-N-acetylmuramoyl-tripeptide:D-alanyl-D-alanine ligase/alanine racemase [Bacteroides sp.]